MNRAPLLAALLTALTFAAPAAATDHVGDVIHRKLDAYGPWYTPAEAAFMRARCGYATDAEIRNISIEGDVMTCGNGRRVEDPQVRVITRDVSRRVYARTRAVMADPEVKAAISGVSAEAARRALADAAAQLAAAQAALDHGGPPPSR